MTSIVTDLMHGYRDLMDTKSDPRVKDWAMMSSPLPTMAICLCYAYFSKVLGPRIMENRKPFTLRRILIVYNFIQTIFSSWIFYEKRLTLDAHRPETINFSVHRHRLIEV